MPDHPVQSIPVDTPDRTLEPGIGLCLSGGGYRAMVFHTGVLWRLYDAGILGRVKRISSVSGGSIVAALLGLKWDRLSFDPSRIQADFIPQVVEPIRSLASETIDAEAIVFGLALPGRISDRIASAYEHHVFGKATLQDLPDDPRFVINATNVQSGVLWRFMKPYMRDYRVGMVEKPDIPLATAVAASSAFPPVLSPVEMRLDPKRFTPNSGLDLQREPFTSKVVLTDGGVYDNLGLETVWKRYDTVLVSDAGGQLAPEEEPKTDWARHSYRVLGIVDNQVRALRKRQTIDSFQAGARQGAYWGIRTNVQDYGLGDALPCPFAQTMQLAETPTRLKRMDRSLQERLINWGYAVSDAALRRHVDPAIARPSAFPYPEAGV
jgi:NTE family protein